MKIETYLMDSEAEADAYLTDLLKDPANRSMNVIDLHVQTLNITPNIKTYFVNKAKEMLKAYGHVIE